MDIIGDEYKKYSALKDYLSKNKEVSLASFWQNISAKLLVVSSASFFEKEVLEIIKKYYIKKTKDDNPAVSFVEDKALKRKFYTFFAWEEGQKGCNTFFASFGKNFKDEMLKKINANDNLKDGAESFIGVVKLRNDLVHDNFIMKSISKTDEEIYEEHKKALKFLEFLRKEIN